MENEQIVEEHLLAKFLAGEASPEEAMAVNDWIEASESNRLHYNQLEKMWMTGASEVESLNQKKIVWAGMQRLLVQQKKHNHYFNYYRIAAGVIILIGAGLGAYFYRASPSTNDIAWSEKQTSNEVANLNLPDGSAVTINRNSAIQWPTKLEGEIREVHLQGEAFFDVAHDPTKPFVISTDEIRIKVLGTAFNVSNSKLGFIETEVIRGKVMMYNSQKQIIIEAGMAGRYNKSTRELTLIKLKNENNEAYATHMLSFESATVKEVCDQLAQTYGVNFVFENKKVQQCVLTSEYQNKSLAFILNVMSETLGIAYEIKGNTVFISGDGCL